MRQWIDYQEVELLLEGYIRIKKIPIWKAKKSFFDIHGIDGINTPQDASDFVKMNIDKIDQIIAWVEASRVEIGKFLIQTGTKARAEDWLADDNDDEPDDDCNEFCITDDNFINSLDIGDIGIDYGENPGMDEFYLEITFDPDYFQGHRIHVGVDSKRQLELWE
jgi:hypothetical protein